MKRLLCLMPVLALLAAGCEIFAGLMAPEVCTADQVEACACANGRSGTRLCWASGTGWDDCQCSAATDAGGEDGHPPADAARPDQDQRDGGQQDAMTASDTLVAVDSMVAEDATAGVDTWVSSDATTGMDTTVYADARVHDGRLDDATWPDTTLPDTVYADASQPDTALPDTVYVDSALPDQAQPDTAATCGNSQVEDGEDCEGAVVTDCHDVDPAFYSGINATCSNCQWNVAACEFCGDTTVHVTEDCEGSTSADCHDIDPGFSSGVNATCIASTCQWNLSNCLDLGVWDQTYWGDAVWQ